VARLGELLGALSLATDAAAGLPLETSLRNCVVATALAHRLGWPDVGMLRRTVLLRHLGCTAFSHESARLAGDDHRMLATYAGVDLKRSTAVAARTLGLGIGAAARLVAHPTSGAKLVASQCAQAAALAEDLGLPPGIVQGLAQLYERHDGRGPAGVAGDAITPGARLLHVAEVVEIYHRTAGRDAAIAEVRRRRGGQLAPDVADAFLAEPDAMWPALETGSVWDRYLDEEPDEPVALDRVARAFGRFADLKSPVMLGHSTAVAALAVAASSPAIEPAALLHDLGVVSVPSNIWDKPGPLNAAEWERVRLHGYHTQRILARAPALADIAVVAGAHHERLDGGGYHGGVNSSQLSADARIVAAADAYRAMCEARPYRAARSAEQAREELARDAREGRLCRRAVDAVLAAAGQRAAARTLPAGLTEREAEVLVHLARGATSKQIASALGITVRTANHHLENIYAKIGVNTRAAAALFAVRNDLVP
jgi:HD-GYP domain-containing protein (c-di-GMP phosphodiesterase class II)